MRKIVRSKGVAIQMTFENTRGTEPIGLDQLPNYQVYFQGNEPTKWAGTVPLYERLSYRQLYPGIDVVVREEGGFLEYDLRLEPGADLDPVQISCEGVDGLSIDRDGSLVMSTPLGEIRQKVPASWCEPSPGSRVPVACRYRLIGESSFGFEVESLDPTVLTVIDPGLVWSRFLGGTDMEKATALTRAPNGDLIIVGGTRSRDFPVSIGAYQTTYQGQDDVFVTRLASDGKHLWSTYFGGPSAGTWGGDGPGDVALDGQGNIVVVGSTDSKQLPIPSVTGWQPFQAQHAGGYADGFVFRLSGDGKRLLHSTYLGGRPSGLGTEAVDFVVIEPSGNVLVTGHTNAPNFPTTQTAYQSIMPGTDAVFVTRLKPDLSGILKSTFLGGSARNTGGDSGALDASGNVLTCGYTTSSDFPVTTGRLHGGSWDGFVTRLDPTLSKVIHSTLIGGSGLEELYSLALGPSGAVAVTGQTDSTNFPTTPNAVDRSYNGSGDGYVTRLDGSLSIVYSTYLGGSGLDLSNRILLSPFGEMIVGGYTSSTNFPITPGAFQSTHAGASDAFVTVDVGGQIRYSTYLGGAGKDGFSDMLVTRSGDVVCVGETASSNFPRTLGPAFKGGGRNGSDAFVSRLYIGTASHYRPFGVGCIGTGTFLAPPRLQATFGQTGPVAGRQFTANLSTFPPFRNGAMMYLGLSNTTWAGPQLQLPFDLKGIGMPGCNLYISPDFLFLMTSPSWTVAIPFSLVGFTFYNQAVVFDQTANILGIVVSNAAEAGIGLR